MYKISIIIPTFNVEKYLDRAFNSLLSQTIGFSNLQIIFVDDCSTDNSSKIIDEYAKMHENVISLHLEKNSGAAGRPRNEGIKFAIADYLLFLDPDDYLLKDACEILYLRITESNADIVVGGYAKNKDWIVPWLSMSKHNMSLITNPRNNISIFLNPPGLSSKLFKKTLILEHKIKFPINIPAQDLVFVTECFLNAKKVLSLNKFIVYCYNHVRAEKGNESISNNVSKTYLYNLLKAYLLTLDLLEKFEVNNYLRNVYFTKHHIFFFVMQLSRSNLKSNEIKELFNSDLFLRFKNQKYIIKDEKLNLFFEKLIKIENFNNFNFDDELDNIWHDARDNFINSMSDSHEENFESKGIIELKNDENIEELEFEIQSLLKKNANLSNLINSLNNF